MDRLRKLSDRVEKQDRRPHFGFLLRAALDSVSCTFHEAGYFIKPLRMSRCQEEARMLEPGNILYTSEHLQEDVLLARMGASGYD